MIAHFFDPQQTRDAAGRFSPTGGARASAPPGETSTPTGESPAPATQTKPTDSAGERPGRPASFASRKAIVEHGRAMVEAHDKDPHILALLASLQKAREDYSTLAKETQNEQDDQVWLKKFSRMTDEQSKITQATEALGHESRRSMLLSFGLPVSLHATLEGNPSDSKSLQAAAWNKASAYLRELISREAIPAQTVMIRSAKGRAYYEFSTIHTHGVDGPEISAHEFGHHLSGLNPWIQSRVNAFRHRRFKPGQEVSMRAAFPLEGYDAEERGNPDDMGKLFDKPSQAAYVGKKYNSGDTEIVSMGLEQLYRDPVRMARVDPEYFSLIISILQQGPKKP